MDRRFKNQTKKSFSITMIEDTVDRLRHVRKVAEQKNQDAYRDLDYTIYKWLLEQEKKLGIDKNDHKTTMFCPECKSKLRIVHSASGDFIGCSSFPKCKYSKNLKS